MVPPMEQLAEALRSRGYDGRTVDAVVFDDETHTSVVPAQVSRTLRVLYGRRDSPGRTPSLAAVARSGDPVLSGGN